MKINFTKMVASGNDFVVIDNVGTGLAPVRNLYRDGTDAVPYNACSLFARKLCDRKYGIGADGVLLLEKSKKADIKMRIFNADGSEAEMCGNGARCVVLWASSKLKTQNSKLLKIETKAGIIESESRNDNVKIKLTDPKDIKIDISLTVNNRNIKVNFINTGVPHTVIFVEGLERIDMFNLGRAIRFHNKFKSAGTNVNFVEVLSNDSIKIRTYERGVEDETLACGTGSAAAAIIFSLKAGISNKINVHTRSGEILRVHFDKINDEFKNVWLEGKAQVVFEGDFNYTHVRHKT